MSISSTETRPLRTSRLLTLANAIIRPSSCRLATFMTDPPLAVSEFPRLSTATGGAPAFPFLTRPAVTIRRAVYLKTRDCLHGGRRLTVACRCDEPSTCNCVPSTTLSVLHDRHVGAEREPCRDSRVD